ncbi:MAG: gliding motility-associated C-terminal domain-containing protein [Bacteroidota bacterium]
MFNRKHHLLTARYYFLLSIFLLVQAFQVTAQFTPIPLNGFSQDVIAEAGPNPVATTTMEIDGLASSNKVMYSAAFAGFASIAGGLPDNGTITNAGDSYQLASYTGNNALFVKRNQTFELTVTTPGPYVKIRLLAFSAEQASTINVGLGFSDGSFSPYLTNYVLADWFNGSTNIVSQGFGRVTRTSTGPFVADGVTSNNPRFYFVEIVLNCVDRAKQLEKIRISNVSTGTNAPFPNTVIMGASGIAFSQTITPTIIASDCNGPNGSIALNVTGSTGPYNFSWNTSPLQSSSTASNLPPGNYTCTITDLAGCTSSFNGTIVLNNNATITATASPALICAGGSTQLGINAGAGVLTDFTWMPGNLTGSSQTVSPAATTTYIVSATNALGCSAASQVTVQVQNKPATPVVNPVSVCSGSNAVLAVSAPSPALTYSWFSAATGGTAIQTGNSYSLSAVTAPATYYVEAASTAGCISDTRAIATLTINAIPADAQLSNVSVCPGSDVTLQVQNVNTATITYRWYPTQTGGTPVATGYSFSLVGVSAPSTWYVEGFSTAGCISAVRTPIQVTLIPRLAIPVVTVTAISFSSLTFSWAAITGATGYQVSTNGGSTFSTPSTGATGLSHTIDGLPGNTTVTLLVRAIGAKICETSLPAGPVSGTTLSTREIFVPNAFTPNNDGKNDIVKVFGNYISTIDFRIFNQWGQLIFQTTDSAQGWDGKHKGKLQPVGVYAYVLKVVRRDGTTVNKKGSINLIH